MSAMRAAKKEAPPAETVGGVVVRPMRSDDVAAVSRLEKETFTTPWNARTFRTLLGRTGAELWVAEDPEAGVIGYYVLWCIQDQGELANIAVQEPFRGRRLGGVLLDHALGVAERRGVESVYLEVRVSNEQASSMYASRGFEQVGIRRNYYDQPREDARVLMRRLPRGASQTSP